MYGNWLPHSFVAEAAHIADIASKLDITNVADAWEDEPEPRQFDPSLWAGDSTPDAGPSRGFLSAADRSWLSGGDHRPSSSSPSSNESSGGFPVRVAETCMSPEIE